VDFHETGVKVLRATYFPPGEADIVNLRVTTVAVSNQEIALDLVTVGLNLPGNDEPWGYGVEFDLDADGARALAQHLIAAADELAVESSGAAEELT
jgi:hypothetical protein